jgi:hypothetical protein
MPSHHRCTLAALTAALVLSQPLLAFNSPLSDEAVREAYFLGQRRDDSYARTMAKYTKTLPPPETGPQISAVTFFTPFALLVQSSSQHLNYSAQQAELDHRDQKETVKVIVVIRFTSSYPAIIPRPAGTRSDSPQGFMTRPYNFWKDFDVQVGVDSKEVLPFSYSGEPDIVCDESGGCTFIGATITLEFLANAFPSDSANILITLPEGDPVSVDFDLTSLR